MKWWKQRQEEPENEQAGNGRMATGHSGTTPSFLGSNVAELVSEGVNESPLALAA